MGRRVGESFHLWGNMVAKFQNKRKNGKNESHTEYFMSSKQRWLLAKTCNAM